MENYLNYLKNVKGFCVNTIITYQRYATVLVNNNLNYQAAINQYSNNSNSTKRIILSAFKSFLKYKNNKAYKEIVLPKSNKKICNYISLKEYQTILSSINIVSKTKYSIYIAIRMLYETGIRSNELLSIKKSDIFDQKVKIIGKGNKERYVYLSKELFLQILYFIHNLSHNEQLFKFKYKNLYKRIVSFSKVINKKISPHSFRRGFATYCINKNISIFDLSLMMGHNQIETTKNYIYEINYENKMKNLFS